MEFLKDLKKRHTKNYETDLRNCIAKNILDYLFSDDYYRWLEHCDTPEEGLMNGLNIAADIARGIEPLHMPPNIEKVKIPEWLEWYFGNFVEEDK